MKIKAAVAGATGYAGAELVRLLYSRSDVEITALSARREAGTPYETEFENFRGSGLVCEEGDLAELAEKSDVLFIALPHGAAGRAVTAEILSKTRVIDLGADFRLKSGEVYEKWYETAPPDGSLLSRAVYGLPELNREKIKPARLIANPGCYATAAILAFAPLVKEGVIGENSVIIDAKSGVSGAGRGATLNTHYCETNENIKAYKVAAHRHTPEIEQEIGVTPITFTPHLTPMNRGILSTGYAALASGATKADIRGVFDKYYGGEFFVKILKDGNFPEPKWVKGSNFCDVGFTVDERTGRLVVISAIDNLVKGAAGQAVQNMNIMFDLPEKTGLDYIGGFPI